MGCAVRMTAGSTLTVSSAQIHTHPSLMASESSAFVSCVNVSDHVYSFSPIFVRLFPYILLCVRHPTVSAKALCFWAASLSVYLFILFVRSFVQTYTVITISHERLEQSQ